ncbi:MAG: alpha-L-arabinofuranosidase C-terminal domain-containing protein, partial [Candidatus Hodarchaeota archaeon]
WNLRGWHHPGHGIRFSKSSIKARDLNDLNETYTMADALFSACFLNSCLRHAEHVKMACIAPGVNARGPLHVHPEGIVKRTTYHVLWMYATILQSNIMPCEVNAEKLPILKSEVTSKGPDVASVAESLPILKPVIESLPVLKSSKMSKVPVVDAVATTDPEGTILTFALVNKHPNQAVECDLGIPNLPDEVEGMILEGDSTDAFNDIEHPDRVVPENRRFPINQGSIRLPPHSLVFFNVKK